MDIMEFPWEIPGFLSTLDLPWISQDGVEQVTCVVTLPGLTSAADANLEAVTHGSAPGKMVTGIFRVISWQLMVISWWFHGDLMVI